jgi:hypothetical protein
VSGRAECPHQFAAACYREPAGAGAAAAHGTRGHAKAPCRKPAHGATIAVERPTKLVCPDFRPSGSGLAPSSARAGPPSRQRTSRRFIRRPCSHELPDGRWPNRSASLLQLLALLDQFWIDDPKSRQLSAGKCGRCPAAIGVAPALWSEPADPSKTRLSVGGFGATSGQRRATAVRRHARANDRSDRRPKAGLSGRRCK